MSDTFSSSAELLDLLRRKGGTWGPMTIATVTATDPLTVEDVTGEQREAPVNIGAAYEVGDHVLVFDAGVPVVTWRMEFT